MIKSNARFEGFIYRLKGRCLLCEINPPHSFMCVPLYSAVVSACASVMVV